MSWDDIQVDDFGWIGKLALKQKGVIVDISSYSTLRFLFQDPSGTVETKVVAFETDGTDGVLEYTIVDGDIDQIGYWEVRAQILKTNVELTSEAHGFNVAPRPN